MSAFLLRVLFLLSAWAWQQALANTEIINFATVGDADQMEVRAYSSEWLKLSRHKNEGIWSIRPAPLETPWEAVCEPSSRTVDEVAPCPHELWVVLDLDHEDWKSYSKFTLRVSWPASSPADFSLQVYSPEELWNRLNGSSVKTASQHGENAALGSSPTRRKYARIRAVDIGVLTPSSTPSPPVGRVPFIILLEPLYLGILPASVLPTLLFLVPLALLAGLGVPWIYAYLERVADRAISEMERDRVRESKKD
ncbi:hypothetical protein PLICRDRAFT_50230 [Plicaturopsis crispa FD-325 SS-3]|nr:hypothetical protein PLICRDRAFT_50230 [Plicaturopsis crispa FD-325 SS-3]